MRELWMERVVSENSDKMMVRAGTGKAETEELG